MNWRECGSWVISAIDQGLISIFRQLKRGTTCYLIQPSQNKGLKNDAAEKSSEIMANLMTAERSVNSLDVLIAGIAIANGAEKIVTGDKDFVEISKVSELKTLLY